MKEITHSKSSNWTQQEHDLLKEALEKFRYIKKEGATHDGQVRADSVHHAVAFAKKNGATKRVIDSILKRALNS